MVLLTQQGQRLKRRNPRRFVELLLYREHDPRVSKTNVSLTWLHLLLKTCDACSAPLYISLKGKEGVSYTLMLIAKLISSALLANLVKENPPT